MRVDPDYLSASQGYLSCSLDSFRFISMCRHGVVAQWLRSSGALSARLNCLHSFAFKSSKALCAIFYNLQLLWFKIHILSGKCPSRLPWVVKKRQMFCVHWVYNFSPFFLEVSSFDFCRKQSWAHRGESCSHSSKQDIVCVTLWHVSEISAGFSASLKNMQHIRFTGQCHIWSRL